MPCVALCQARSRAAAPMFKSAVQLAWHYKYWQRPGSRPHTLGESLGEGLGGSWQHWLRRVMESPPVTQSSMQPYTHTHTSRWLA